ncbi:MAG: hypothetical protein Q9Q13_09350 [Acidobacteriota bacterium]|nr:hypothetical protein [Acidobacteriota bacterium]
MEPGFPFHFVLHDHQPYGNFPEVFEAAWERAYGPTLAILDRHPDFRFGLHITGALWEWIERHRPQAMETIAGMVTRNQVELIGGPFYEPVLALVTPRDAAGQIGLMRRFLERHFGVASRGAWLAERVWQPDLPELLEDAGVTFTFVDDTHLFTAGPDGKRIGNHVLAESRGKRVALFPIDFKLRYAIPFQPAAQTVQRLLELQAAGCSSATYADDGEKLGLWPGTMTGSGRRSGSRTSCGPCWRRRRSTRPYPPRPSITCPPRTWSIPPPPPTTSWASGPCPPAGRPNARLWSSASNAPASWRTVDR